MTISAYSSLRFLPARSKSGKCNVCRQAECTTQSGVLKYHPQRRLTMLAVSDDRRNLCKGSGRLPARLAR